MHIAYKDVWEYISDELRWLDLKIERQLAIQKLQQPESEFDQFKGLVLSEEEIYHLLNESPVSTPADSAITQLEDEILMLEREIERRKELSLNKGIFLPLPYLSSIFALSAFEEKCLVICLAVELERKYEKLYAFLQNDVTCKYPTMDLVIKLLCPTVEDKLKARLVFLPEGRLSRHFFKLDDEAAGTPALSRVLRLDERILGFMLNPDGIDEALSLFTHIIPPDDEPVPLLLDIGLQERMRQYIRTVVNKHDRTVENTVFYFWGPAGAGKRLHARHLCSYIGKPMMLVDLPGINESGSAFRRLLGRISREAAIKRAALCFCGFDVLTGSDNSAEKVGMLLESANGFPDIVFLLADHTVKQTDFMKGYSFVDVEFGIPTDVERKLVWENFSRGYRFESELDWGVIASKFRFTPGQIRNALTTAANMSGWNNPGHSHIDTEELYKACYSQGHHKLGKKAARIQPKYTWDDVILPLEQKTQLKNACNQVKYRHIVYGEWGFGGKLSYGKGLSMLFSGPPGTGKTMSAQVVANELHLELYKIDLSQVVSKYIGETEKNLQEIFNEAQLSNAILFFDETDALFGKRSEVKDSHDRYANIETAFLLQKVEEYEGITILATNFIQNIDEAFMRRINFIIEFPFPDNKYREKIWRSVFPEDAPLEKDIDYEFIAKRFEVSGGNIKNIAVAAAFLAAEGGQAVGMKHIVRAARYEMHKIGKILLKEDLGEYYSLVED